MCTEHEEIFSAVQIKDILCQSNNCTINIHTLKHIYFIYYIINNYGDYH